MKYWSNVHGWATSVYGDVHDYWTHWIPHHATSTYPTAAATSTSTTTTSATSISVTTEAFKEPVMPVETVFSTTSISTIPFESPTPAPETSISLEYTNTTEIATPTPSSITSAPEHGESNSMFIALVVACVFLGLILLYLLVPFFMRLGIFICNVTQLLFKRQGSFADDGRMGLTSSTFDISGNLQDDGREGLDKKSKLRILVYMLVYAETFDEARFRLVRYQFAQNGIAPDGQPLDPKSVRYAV